MPRSGRPRSHELRRIAWLVVALSWMFTAAPVSAQNSTRDLTLTWDVPRECPDRGAVLARIAKHLRDERKFPDDWSIDAHVLRKQAQFELKLTLRRGGAEAARRTLRSASCVALAEATAVFVALAVDLQPSAADASEVAPEQVPGSKPSTEPSSSEPTSRESTAVEPHATRAPTKAQHGPPSPAVQARSQTPRNQSDESEAELEPAADGGRRQSLRVGLGIGLGVRLDAGMLPTPRFGLQARVELRLLRLRAALGFTWLPPVETIAETYPAASIRASGILGDGMLGYALLEGRLSLLPCAMFEYGTLSLEGRRIVVPGEQSVRWTAAGAGARATYRLGAGFELGFEAAGLAPFSRPRSWVQTDRGDMTLFHATAVALRVSAGIAYVFE